MKRVLFALALLIVYALVTFTVYADSPPKYSVREWRISAVVNPDGSMDVEEYITYDVPRSHEGPVVRHIDIAHSSSIEKLEVFSMIPTDTEGSDQAELEPYEFVDKSDQNMSKVYTTKPGDSPEEVQEVIIYLPAGGGEHTVGLKYRLNDLVSLYRDTAVFYWNPVVKGYGLDVRNMDMRIALPQGTKPDGVKPFVYGALEGSCEVLEDGTVGVTAKKLGSKEFMEVTLVFPKDGVAQGRKVIDNDGLGRILEEQRLKAEEMELLRRREEQQKLRLAAMAGAIAGIVGIGVCVGVWMSRCRLRLAGDFSQHRGQTYGKPGGKGAGQVVTKQPVGVSEKPRVDKQGKMPAIDLPADYYTPAELSVLLRGKRIKPGDVVATLIDLAARRYLDVEASGGKCYVLCLRDFKRDSLKAHEEYLIDWLFKDIGDGKKVSTEAILQAAYGGGFNREFYNRFVIWRKLVVRQSMRWGFSKRGTPFKVYRRTPFGKHHYKNWVRFKKALKKLSREADSLPPADWERFFAYALSLGIGQLVVKGLKKAYPEGLSLSGDLAIFSRDNFRVIYHWLDLAKRLNLMRFRLFRLFCRPAIIQLFGVERNEGKSI
ncbi:MAG: hypothetical protein PWR01_1046 [Clostridiales bacterium]|nr:hypothetical protein [Clostridiales bacterium]